MSQAPVAPPLPVGGPPALERLPLLLRRTAFLLRREAKIGRGTSQLEWAHRYAWELLGTLNALTESATAHRLVEGATGTWEWRFRGLHQRLDHVFMTEPPRAPRLELLALASDCQDCASALERSLSIEGGPSRKDLLPHD